MTHPDSGHDYYLLEASDWSDAEEAARGMNGHLATVNDAEELEWIYATFGNYQGQPRHLWIGLYDANSNVDSANRTDRMSEFVWISGEASSYQRWSPFEPNDSGGGEECAHIWAPTDPYASYWNDADPALTNLFGVGLHGVVELTHDPPPRGEIVVNPTGPPDLLPVAGQTRKIEQLVGDFDRERNIPTANLTDSRYQIWGTDLGIPFVHGNKTWVLFGDTIGAVGGDRDVMASSTDPDPADGLALTFPSSGGVYQPLTVPGLSQGAFEVPVEGVSANGRMVVYLTTDHSSVVPMGRSVVAVSDDDGQTFTQLYTLSRRYFLNVSVVSVPIQEWPGLPPGTGEGLLIFGSGSYRQSNVRLAYQPAAEVEQRSLLYLTGLDACGRPQWAPDEELAVSLFDQPCVGEFSVAYYPALRRWVMLYNCGDPRGINMRSAVYPWGPWSESRVLFDPWLDGGYCQFMHVNWQSQNCDSVHDPGRENHWAGEYGPYLFENWFKGNSTGGTIYFTISTWNPYTVVLMQADLKFSNPTKAPELSVGFIDDQLFIRWPCEFQNYALKSGPLPGGGPDWTPVPGLIEIVNGMNEMTVPIQTGQRFFRLERP